MSEASRTVIGNLSFVLNDEKAFNGKYGKVFPGLVDDTVDVSILRMDITTFAVDTKTLWSANQHHNIIRFYGSEDAGEFRY